MCITHVYKQKEENDGVALGKFWAVGGTDLFFTDSLFIPSRFCTKCMHSYIQNTIRHGLDKINVSI